MTGATLRLMYTGTWIELLTSCRLLVDRDVTHTHPGKLGKHRLIFGLVPKLIIFRCFPMVTSTRAIQKPDKLVY